MEPIKTQIDIGATPEIVWRVLTDFSAYPKWNPYLRGILGEARAGERLKVRARLSKKRVVIFGARVTKAVPAMELSWREKKWVGGLFDAEHSFIIIPNGVNGVRFVQKKSFSGWLVPMLLPMVRHLTEAGIERMNEAIKKTAEDRH